MRRWSLVSAGAVALATALLPRPTEAADAAAEVLQRDAEMAKAVVAGDLTRLEDIYADDYVFVGSDGRPVTRAERLGALQSGKLRYVSTRHGGITVRVYGDTAVVQGQTHSNVVSNGRQVEGDFQYVGVWVRRSSRWRIVLTQATRIAP